jgi:imidazolonepropionase-like amidohydrolase
MLFSNRQSEATERKVVPPVLTLKAAGFVDVDTGELVSPGVLRIEGDRIAGGGGPADDLPDAGDQVIDLGDLILLPGLLDMEVNLRMGGRGETI